MNTPNEDQVAALVIHTDGRVERLELVAGDTLQQLYKAIDCTLVETVSLTDRVDMWLDEEGLYTGQKVNRLATVLARRYGYVHQSYRGAAVVAAHTPDGDTVNLTDDQLAALTAQIGEVQ